MVHDGAPAWPKPAHACCASSLNAPVQPGTAQLCRICKGLHSTPQEAGWEGRRARVGGALAWQGKYIREPGVYTVAT